MSSDIGPGDVVVQVVDGTHGISKRGSRYTVRRVYPAWPCRYCGECVGLTLWEMKSPPNGFAGCAFRKIGGSRSDTIRKFAEDLNIKPPANTPSKREKV